LYKFVQNKKIPSYLFAFMIGDIVERKIDERNFVIAEKVRIDESVRKL